MHSPAPCRDPEHADGLLDRLSRQSLEFQSRRAEGECWRLRDRANPPGREERKGRAAVSKDLAPLASRAQAGAVLSAPDTPTAPRRPALVRAAAQWGLQRGQRRGRAGQRGPSARGSGAHGAGSSAHLAVHVPERPAAASPCPAWFPAPGSPSPPHGRLPLPQPPVPTLDALPLRPGSASGPAGSQRLGRARKALAPSLRSESRTRAPASLLPPALAASCCHLGLFLPPPGGRLENNQPPVLPCDS